MLPSGPAPEKESVAVFDFDTPRSMSLGAFVARLVNDGGLFLNDKGNDWVPLHRVVRVWQGAE